MNKFLKRIEEDTAKIIEKRVGVKAVIIYADGKEQTKSAIDPEKDLMCWFVRESRMVDRETGYDTVSNRPMATFRTRALDRMPISKAGKHAFVRVKTSAFSEEMTIYQIAGPPRSGRTIGYINFQLQSASQI